MTETVPGSEPVVEADARPSLSRNSAARFAAESTSLVLGAATATVTARLLGPSTKGLLSALSFVTMLLAHACLLGLNDAAIVRVSRGESTAQEALSSSLGLATLSSAVGALLLCAYAWLALPLDQPYVRLSVATGCLSLPVNLSGLVMIGLLNTQERMVASSIIFLSITGVAAVTTAFFIAVLHLSVLGGMLGALVGLVVGLVAATVLLERDGFRFRPRLDPRYLRPAFRFGIRVQASYMLTIAVARLDLLLVYSLAGSADAGVYSIALTFGTLSGTVAIALSYASFPRLAQLDEAEAQALTVRLVRVGLAAALAVAVAAGALVPVIVRVLLGPAYGGATVPALLLLVGGVFWSAQWLLARAYAARGDPSLQLVSFLVNLVVMVALDLALIPHWRSTGAAFASIVGPAVGVTICLRRHRATGASLLALLPRLEDFRQLATFVRRPLRLS
jgi:O-antigen/teichoic acid export membrane protein